MAEENAFAHLIPKKKEEKEEKNAFAHLIPKKGGLSAEQAEKLKKGVRMVDLNQAALQTNLAEGKAKRQAEEAKKKREDDAKLKRQRDENRAKNAIRSAVLKKPTAPETSFEDAKLQRTVARKPATNPKRSQELRAEVNAAKDSVAKTVRKVAGVIPTGNLPLPGAREAVADFLSRIPGEILLGPIDKVAEVGTIANPEESLETRVRAGANIGLAALPLEEAVAGTLWKAGRNQAFRTAERLGGLGADVTPVQNVVREGLGRVLLRPQGEIKNVGRIATTAVEKSKGAANDAFIQRQGSTPSLAVPKPRQRQVIPEPVTTPVQRAVDVPPVAPQVVPTVEPPIPPTKYAASNAATTDARARVGMDPVQSNVVPNVDPRATYDPALTLQRVRQAIDDVSKGRKPVPLNDVETKHIGYAIADQEKAYNDITARIAQAVERGEDVRPLQQMRSQIEKDFDDLTTGSRYIGTEQGRALAARNAASLQDYTPAGLYRDWQATAGRKLDPVLQKKADDLGIQLEEANLRIRQYEEAEAQRLAQANIRAGRSGGSKAPKEAVEQIRARRSAAVERLQRKLVASELSAGLDPTKLADIAGDVIEIAKTYADEGVVVLKDVVTRIRGDLDAVGVQLEDADVHRILAGEFERAAKPTMSEAQKRLAALKKAAKDTDAARNARAARLAPGRQARAEKAADVRITRRQLAEEARAERQRIAAARAEGRRQAAQARKEYTDFWKQEIAEYEQFWKESIPGQREKIEEQIGRLEEMIRTGDIAPPKPKKQVPKELEDLIIKRKALEVEANNIKAQLRAEREWENMSTGEKVLAESASTLRGLKATLDLSAVLNQGMWLLRTGRWRTLGRGTRDMLKSFLSPAQYNQLRGSIASNPYYERARAAGLSLNVSDLDEPSEYAVSKILGKTLGNENVDLNLLAGSDRAYSAFLNQVRMSTFESLVKGQERPWMKALGIKDLSLDELKATADYVNNVTGVASSEGAIGQFANSLKAANQNLPLFFAPGYRVSRWQTALGHPLFRASTRRNPRLAAQVLQDYLAFGASLYGTVQAAKLMGYDVDTDMQSPTFGQLRMGRTYVDITGGLLKPLQMMAAATAGSKRTPGGNASKPQPFQVLGNYAASGLHPAVTTPGTIVAGAQGSKLFGKSYDPKTDEGQKNLWLLLAPISIGQQFEIGEDPSLTPAQRAVLRITAILGAGVNYREAR